MQSMAKGDTLQRMAGISFIVGAVLVMFVNIFFPRASDPSDTQAWIQAWANAGSFFKVINLIMAAGMWAMVIGSAGIYRSHITGASAAWTRLGFYGVLIGVTLWTLTAISGIGISSVLEQMGKSAEPAKGTLLLVASSLMSMMNTVWSMSILVFWLALTFLGIGMLLGAVYPKWLSWSILVLSVLTWLTVGIPQTLGGLSSPVTNVFFPVLAGLSLVWALVMGIWTLRKSW